LNEGANLPRPDIIVVGASAGGVEALQILGAGLPANLPAAVFVVLHVGNGTNGRSELPKILENAGSLPAKHPVDGESIVAGTIYVAPPDYHLLVSAGNMHLSHGPKENWTRPAINPLFRSAADTYGGRVVGVILTGNLDDGVAGLAEIKRQGGLAIAEDPATAFFPSMPQAAQRQVALDYVLPLDKIPPLIAKLVTVEHTAVKNEESIERVLTKLTCPECRGPLSEERQGTIVEYRCRVGHAYSPMTMAAEHQSTVERTLWASVLSLEEAADIAEHLGPKIGAQAVEDAQKQRENAALIRKMLDPTSDSPQTGGKTRTENLS
jgi:two-component system chemotaxis response regulator CheB